MTTAQLQTLFTEIYQPILTNAERVRACFDEQTDAAGLLEHGAPA